RSVNRASKRHRKDEFNSYDNDARERLRRAKERDKPSPSEKRDAARAEEKRADVTASSELRGTAARRMGAPQAGRGRSAERAEKAREREEEEDAESNARRAAETALVSGRASKAMLTDEELRHYFPMTVDQKIEARAHVVLNAKLRTAFAAADKGLAMAEQETAEYILAGFERQYEELEEKEQLAYAD
ncbi:MAG: hypothetical protein BJ554DRAFT_5082, partial [Olpidium bornovanus]